MMMMVNKDFHNLQDTAEATGLGVVCAVAVVRLDRQCTSDVVRLVRQQPVTAGLDGSIVPEPRQVEHGCTEEDEHDREAGAPGVDVAAGVQWSTDCEVPAECHVDRQPRATDLEHVDESLHTHTHTRARVVDCNALFGTVCRSQYGHRRHCKFFAAD